MAHKSQVTYRRPSAIVMLAAVPYLLLSASQSVKLTTTVNLDGSGLRRYTVICVPDRTKEVQKRLLEQTPGFDHQSRRREGTNLVIIRDWRPANIAEAVSAPDAAASLEITDIIRKPLSVFTEYHWSEQVNIYRETATDVETFGEEIAGLRYELKMPGKIVQSKTNADRIEGRAAIWELSADVDTYTLEATSQRLRWGYLLVILYILGFISYQVIRYVARLVRNRPRKI